MRIVIPTKGRAATVARDALSLFPDATLCVGEDEERDYAGLGAELVTHPATVVGIGPLRQWCLDRFDDELLVMADDDVFGMVSWCGFRSRRVDDPAQAMAVVERAAICARDAGAHVFGFGQKATALDYEPQRPVRFSTWVGGVVGFVGRRRRYDTALLLRADIDYCLRSLLEDRIVWCENRWGFLHQRFEGRGGNAAQRTLARHRAEIDTLRRRWGPHLVERAGKSTVRLQVRVER